MLYIDSGLEQRNRLAGNGKVYLLLWACIVNGQWSCIEKCIEVRG